MGELYCWSSDKIAKKEKFQKHASFAIAKGKAAFFSRVFLLICTTSRAACQTLRVLCAAQTTCTNNHMHAIASLGMFHKGLSLYHAHFYCWVIFRLWMTACLICLVSLIIWCSLICQWLNHVTGGQWIGQHEETQSWEGMLPSACPPLWCHHDLGRPCYFCQSQPRLKL